MRDYWSLTPTISLALRALFRGEVIAYPTEAVWGLGCDPFNPEAVNKILTLKNRSIDKGLILIASELSQLAFVLKDLPENQIARMRKTWPGPTTWIVPKNKYVPYSISGHHAGVAVRVSNHPLVQALCHAYGGPIVSTSANPQGKPAAKTRWQVERYFGRSEELSFVTKGTVGKRNRPSDIIDLLSESIVRS
ncbi:MAG: L-threonylcarbamoyladenylate synthase [Cellvibrionaceae bacterium]